MNEKKYFRNCPFENTVNRCVECENYEMCLRRKKKLVAERKAKRRKKNAKIILCKVFIMFVILGAIVAYTESKGHMVVESKYNSVPQSSNQYSTETVDYDDLLSSTENDEFQEKTATVIKKTSDTFSKEGYDEDSTEEIDEDSVVEEEETEEEETVVEPRISAYEAGEVYYYNLSSEDKKYIEKLVWAESRGECFEGQVAVAAVVLNRYTSNSAAFNTKSIYSVITQSGQFASIDGITQSDLDTVPSCADAVEAACKGWDPTRKVFSEGAKYFYAPGELSTYQASIRQGVETLSIGNHNFHNDFNE